MLGILDAGKIGKSESSWLSRVLIHHDSDALNGAISLDGVEELGRDRVQIVNKKGQSGT